MPRIKGKEVKSVEIEVSDREFAEMVINHLYRMIGLSPIASQSRSHYSIKGNTIYVEYEEGGGSHSWFTEDVVREATPLDIATFEVIRAIHKFSKDTK